MKSVGKYLLLVLMAALLSAAIAWANYEASVAKCQGVQVDILRDSGDTLRLLNEDGIRQQLRLMKLNITNQPLSRIDTDSIEQMLNGIDYLENAECVVTADDRLSIVVRQMTPVVRLFARDGRSYYLNRDSKQMQADAKYHVDVPIVSGNINIHRLRLPYLFADYAVTRLHAPKAKVAEVLQRSTLHRLIALAEYVASPANAPLDTYVTSIYYSDPANIYLVPAIEGHLINVGDGTGMDSKIAKLKKFYNQVIPEKGWWMYDTVSLKWDYQVVATKRDRVRPVVIDTIPDDPDEADIETMTINPATASAPKEAAPAAAATANKADAKPSDKPADKPKNKPDDKSKKSA